MNKQAELTGLFETITESPRHNGLRNPRPIHGFADCGPILGVITLGYVQGYIEGLDHDPLTKEEIRDFVSLSRMYDRYPKFSEIIEDVRLNPLYYPPSSDDVPDKFRYLWHYPSKLGEILDVVTLDEVENFLGSNGHAPLTEAERFCFASYFEGPPTLHWVDDIVNKIRPEIGRIGHAAKPNQFCQVNDESSLSFDVRNLPPIRLGVSEYELHFDEIHHGGTRRG